MVKKLSMLRNGEHICLGDVDGQAKDSACG